MNVDSLEKTTNNVGIVKTREDIKSSEVISTGEIQVENGVSSQRLHVMGDIDILSKSIEENKRRLSEIRKNLGLPMIDEDPPSIQTSKERLGKLQIEAGALGGSGRAKPNESQAIMKRYLDSGPNAEGLDPRIIDYFRNYIGLEETYRRFNNMTRQEQEDIVVKIKTNDIDAVVKIMENFTQTSLDQFHEAVVSMRDLLPMPDDLKKWKQWNQEEKSAKADVSTREHKIRMIIDRLNKTHSE